jgi:Mu transposase, C-terminal
VAWMDLDYSRNVHSETSETPLDRWRAGIANVRYADEEKVRLAFLWNETRKADKAGVFSLFGCEYQVGPTLGGKAVVARYDPEQLEEIEVWHDGRFVERARPFAVKTHRRPRPADEDTSAAVPKRVPVVDWLGHLRDRRQAESFVEPTPRQLADALVARRVAQDDAIVALLADRLDPAVRDDDEARAYLGRYGPFNTGAATAAVDRLIGREGRDQHVQRYLDAIRREGGAS